MCGKRWAQAKQINDSASFSPKAVVNAFRQRRSMEYVARGAPCRNATAIASLSATPSKTPACSSPRCRARQASFGPAHAQPLNAQCFEGNCTAASSNSAASHGPSAALSS
eukprot:5440051-Heterocapsa_arctica.AAC.1